MYRHWLLIYSGRPSFTDLTTILLVLVVVFPAASSASPAEKLQPLTLMTRWTPQAQFAGYYAAKAKGFYAHQGIGLNILAASPSLTSAEALLQEKVDFSVIWLSTALCHQASDADLAHLTQTIPRSSMLFVSRCSAGITTLKDLQGRSLGLWPGGLSLPAHVLLDTNDIQVREIRKSGTVNLFPHGGIDAISAMTYNEYHRLLSAELEPEELNVISVAAEGIDFPEDELYARKTLTHTRPALVDAFMQASREGWRYAFQHPDEAIEIVLEQIRQAQPPASTVHQRWMLDQLRPLMLTSHRQLDDQLPQPSFDHVLHTLLQRHLISQPVDLNDFLWRPSAR